MMKSIWRNPFFWGAIFGVAFVTGIRPFMRRIPAAPAVLFKLPHFALTNQTGQTFGTDQLKGHVYIANFFFTRCPSVCPKLTKAMKGLQDRYDRYQVQEIKLVSISVDPSNDTPAVLANYAKKFGADFKRWNFLTGEEEDIRNLANDGFRTHVGENNNQAKENGSDSILDIAHTGSFALVDGEGQVRGFYHTDEQGLDEIFHRAQHVLKEAKQRARSNN